MLADVPNLFFVVGLPVATLLELMPGLLGG